MAKEMFDVIQVNIDTKEVRLMGVNKDEANAEAVMSMAIMRRGVEGQFFTLVPHGRYKDGDEYQPEPSETTPPQQE